MFGSKKFEEKFKKNENRKKCKRKEKIKRFKFNKSFLYKFF